MDWGMIKKISILNILSVMFLFFLTTLISVRYTLDVFKINFLIATFYMLIVNPYQLKCNKLCILGAIVLILFGCFYLVEAKMFCPLFFGLFI